MPKMFLHPLSESWTDKSGEQMLNSWAMASFLIHFAATGSRYERTKAAREKAIEFINIADPMIDADVILNQAKKSPEGLLRAITLLEEGFTRYAQKVTGYTGAGKRC